MDDHNRSEDEVRAEDLTWREQDILYLLAQRLTNREIAQHLHLAESTVKDYVGKILSKLYVKNRRQAVERAKALGLLDSAREAMLTSLTNLPTESTPFIGREDELAEIKSHLGETQLLTLIGPGGIGKTRLAIKTASEIAEEFNHGCFFVSLAPILAVDHICQSIAEAVRFPLATHEDPQIQLLRYLKNRQLLLILDNFEHLLEGTHIVSELLQTAPEVKILISSREKLNLHSETTVVVGGMNIPHQELLQDVSKTDAVSLFVQSARKARPGYNPSLEELEFIVRICRLVEGMPLAIELAAAWLHVLNVDEIVHELEKDLDILSSEVRDAPERHRSIRAVFDHSWSMLDQKESEIFKSLSVFRGGFTREAAQEVSGATLRQLAQLVNKSFFNLNPDSGRFEIHELLRQYGQEQLGKTVDFGLSAQQAHTAYFADFMQRRWQDLKGSRQMQALYEIEADIENVRAAWRHSLELKKAHQIWMFIYGLWYLYWIRWWNHAGRELFAEAVKMLWVENDQELAILEALAKAYQAYFMAWLDLAEQGYALAQESVDTLRQLNHREALFFACNSLSVNSYFLYKIQEEFEAINEMVEISTELGDEWLQAFGLFAAGWVALLTEDYGEARRLAENQLKIFEEIGDEICLSMPLIILGHVALALGEHEEASDYYRHSFRIAEKTGFYYALQTASKYLGKVSISTGRIQEAEEFLRQSLLISKEIGFVRDIVNLFYEFARLRVAQGNLEGALRLLALVIKHPASRQKRWLEGRIQDSAKDLQNHIQGELTRTSYLAALRRGRELGLDETVTKLLGSSGS